MASGRVGSQHLVGRGWWAQWWVVWGAKWGAQPDALDQAAEAAPARTLGALLGFRAWESTPLPPQGCPVLQDFCRQTGLPCCGLCRCMSMERLLGARPGPGVIFHGAKRSPGQ